MQLASRETSRRRCEERLKGQAGRLQRRAQVLGTDTVQTHGKVVRNTITRRRDTSKDMSRPNSRQEMPERQQRPA
jgi:hypothetical protein